MAITHKYYSLKGRVYISELDASENPINGIFVGNVPSAKIAMTRTTEELKTSMDASNADLASEEKEKSASLSIDFNSQSTDLVKMYLYGAVTAQAADTITAEDLGDFAAGETKALANAKVSNVVVKAGVTTLTVGTDYTVSTGGSITMIAAQTDVTVDYDCAAMDIVQAFAHSGKEYHVRFESDIASDTVVVKCYRWKPNPSADFGFISDTFNKSTLEGKLLQSQTLAPGHFFDVLKAAA